ncbi:MAG: hypothetical protein O3A29_19735 [Planctomycetota bacterium]|nr:hypothetical protein [Planctomycetota bacterium]
MPDFGMINMMNLFTRIQPLYLVSVFTLCITGCGGVSDAPVTIPVSGKVSYNGTGVKNASITFSPLDAVKSRAAQASCGEDGSFQTPEGKGLMPGKYKIVIQAYKTPLAEISPKDLATQGGDNNLAVPKKYMDLSTTDLEVEISESDSSKKLMLDLKD